jgi:hypothetical protein
MTNTAFQGHNPQKPWLQLLIKLRMQKISKTDPENAGHGVDEKVPVGSRLVAGDGGKMPNSVS